MSAIVGLAGLEPTINIIKYSKTIAIANKESIICGWNLIKKKINKYNVRFIPADSEHFSIWSSINSKKKIIDKIYLTASGGPFYKRKFSELENIQISQALKHPTWKMGKKISIDSATLINKIFEVIEASKIFDIEIKKIKIILHPSSYVHALIKFSNGLMNIIAHDTSMKIPIFNTIYWDEHKPLKTKKLILKN
jgi:1-deoxy-D-xylulose-5-phosphate reductoisomerase